MVDIEGYYRLFGMFRESGVFQIFLNTAIIMELFLRKGRVRFFKLSVLLAGLILTFSTPGYLATILILISYTFFSKKKISEKEKKSIIAGVMLLVVMLLVLYFSNSTFSDGINNAWTKLTNKESSYLGRTTSIIVELKLWSEKPIFGYGIQEGFELSKTAGMETLGFYMFNTSTITGLLVTFGGIFTLILVLMLLAFSLRLKTNFIGAFLITIGIFIMISSQLMMYNAYFYALLFISIKNMKYRKRIEEKTDSLETALTVGRWHNAETEI
ncbi:O-antigen ligase family protein [Sporosarcina luteola]|uniref:O-antigen ligase family protein n=1 Tax=Sporosarcina luteola TaxID=582850 RepID=UPI00203BAD90|nr:O-antigen ligase family protein [Sporosarcina luteola]MCM3636545.1 O-antigen ligase family protein [Sporosarcina luteola]